MPGELDHLRWTRLEIESVLKPRKPPPPPRPRLNRGEHAQRLHSESASAFDLARQSRLHQGISPDRLLVLRMRFLDATQRELLAKLGLQILDEREERTPLAAPIFEVQVEFPNVAAADALRQWPMSNFGIVGIQSELGSGGTIHPARSVLQFSDRDVAKQACEPDRGGIPVPFTVRGSAAQKVKSVRETRIELATIQFQDQQARDRFFRELQTNRSRDADTNCLTPRERAVLFDALESVSNIGPDQRRGGRLIREGVPDGDDLALDVDLWHPGTAELAPEAEAQFRDVVERFGGRVTGIVRPILRTLMIARVRGSRRLLDELLTYDRVSRIDLPPVVETAPTTIFQHSPVMADPVQIPNDGPLACVVDSGIVSGHPLLRDLVVDEEDFNSGEDTPVDLAGHGTEVAGVVAYGDLRTCLESGNLWVPKVRLINAKVMKARLDWDGSVFQAGFADNERAETQIADAIARFATDPDRRCRVFNLSLGNADFLLNRGHQLPWAMMLDELARKLDIVVVVSAGNVSSPEIPPTPSAEDFQTSIREQILSDAHSLIDPASAINVLTVGSLARHEVPHQRDSSENRPDLVASPKNGPSPFTRTGLLRSNGSGTCRTVKPELVAFGGNYSLTDGRWYRHDFTLSEPVLNFNFATQHVLRYSSGTSIAAPYVTHVCAITEHRLRQLNGDQPVSANLIRAFVAHSAIVPPETSQWLSEGHSKSESLNRRLRAVGYGRPDPSRSCYSTENRVLLYAEDQIAERRFHLYQLEMPSEFIAEGGDRLIRATLAFDPPVRGTRLEYQSRAMTMQLIRGVSTDEVRTALSKLEGDATNIALPARAKRFQPQRLEWSTLQSQATESCDKRNFVSPEDDEHTRLSWHLLVGCKHRFDVDDTDIPQPYAIVLSLEHSNSKVRLYQALKSQVQVTAQVRQRGR